MSLSNFKTNPSDYAIAYQGVSGDADVQISFRRILLILFYGYFAFGTLFQIFPPVLSELQAEFSINNNTVSLVMSVFLAPILVLAIPAGLAVDRWGPVPAIRVGFGFMLAGIVLVLLTSSWWFLLAGRLVSGAGGAFLLVSLLKVVAQSVPRDKLGLAVGVFAAGLPVGTVVAFNILRPLESIGSWRFILLAAGAVVLSAVAVFELAAGRRLAKGGASVNVAHVLNNPAMLRLAAVTIFGYAAIVGFTTWAPKMLENGIGVSAGIAALIASLLLMIDIPFSPFWGGVSDRLQKRKLLILLAFGLYLAGSLLVPGLAAGGSVLFLVLVIVVMGIGCSMFFPAALAIPAETVSQDHCGAAYGMIFTAQVTGMLIGPQLVGWVLDATSATGAFLAISLTTAVGFALSFLLRAR